MEMEKKTCQKNKNQHPHGPSNPSGLSPPQPLSRPFPSTHRPMHIHPSFLHELVILVWEKMSLLEGAWALDGQGLRGLVRLAKFF